jgi:hypothetical protein
MLHHAASIAKLVKEYMPADLRVSTETTDKILECCTGARPRARPPLPTMGVSNLTAAHATHPRWPTVAPTPPPHHPTFPPGFVTLVSTQANDIATAEKKSTITPEHVLKSLEALGFGGYGDDVKAAWEQIKEESKRESLTRGLLRVGRLVVQSEVRVTP